MSGTVLAGMPQKPASSRIVLARMNGTAIDLYDFYIYGTAALILGRLFFSATDDSARSLAALATFGIAFVAWLVGSFLFSNFGDRYGRKSALVGSLVAMSLLTTVIAAAPPCATAGALPPAALSCLLRLGHGIGLGGEWGAAILLASENGPRNPHTLFGMFPQLGPPLSLLLSVGQFPMTFKLLTDAQFATGAGASPSWPAHYC